MPNSPDVDYFQDKSNQGTSLSIMKMVNALQSKFSLIFWRLVYVFRMIPRRIVRIIQHFYSPKFISTKHCKWRKQRTFLEKMILWNIQLFCLLIDLIGLPEWYMMLSEITKYNSRSLHLDEIKLCQSIFGNEIDFRIVSIDERAFFVCRRRNIVYVGFSTINSWGEITNPTLIHEMVHIWQYQQFGSLYILQALHAQFFGKAYAYGWPEFAVEIIENDTELMDFNFEQQAQIIEDFFRGKMLNRTTKNASSAWPFYQQIISTTFPYYFNKTSNP